MCTQLCSPRLSATPCSPGFPRHTSATASMAKCLRRPPRERQIRGSIPAFSEGIFQGRVLPATKELALRWLPCQVSDVIGSTLGLVGPVSVYRDWVKFKVRSAASASVWQHVQLSEQNRSCDTLACCWDVKQPTNNNNSTLQLLWPALVDTVLGQVTDAMVGGCCRTLWRSRLRNRAGGSARRGKPVRNSSAGNPTPLSMVSEIHSLV